MAIATPSVCCNRLSVSSLLLYAKLCHLDQHADISATTLRVFMARKNKFAAKLRWWRAQRGISQLALAQRAGISQRHLSFLELARAQPSRIMVEKIASALDVPLREHNALLVAAGYAPVWRQTDLSAPELTAISNALDYIMAQQEPYPAVAVDRHWNLLRANNGAVRLVEFLVGPLEPGAKVNLADALVAPNVLRPYLVNWPDVVRFFLRSVEADAVADGTEATASLLARLRAYPGIETALAAPVDELAAPVLPMHFSKGDTTLRLFTTIATLGTPQDITLQELRIECFFPMDNSTVAVLRAWAASAPAKQTR
jgi:transcriptional regulator with XRE-family HTH domain